MTNEILTLQIGKTGILTGNEYWKSMLVQNEVSPDCLKFDKNLNNNNCFFKESIDGSFIPRTIIFDLSLRDFELLKKTNYSKLYDRNNHFIINKNTGNSWLKGYYEGVNNQNFIENIIRKDIEKMNSMRCFNIFNSINGGTGAGLTSYIIEYIRSNFPKSYINCCSIFPDIKGNTQVTFQPYNSVMSIAWQGQYSDSNIFFQNHSIESLLLKNQISDEFSFKKVNYVIGNTISFLMNLVNPKFSIERLFSPLIVNTRLNLFCSTIHLDKILRKLKKKKKFSDFLESTSNDLSLNLDLKFGNLLSGIQIINKDSRSFYDSEIFNNKFSTNKSENNLQLFDFSDFIPKENKKKKENFSNPFFLVNHTSINIILKEIILNFDLLKKRNAFMEHYSGEIPLQEANLLFREAKNYILNIIDIFESLNYSS